jgi:hypothetical protein
MINDATIADESPEPKLEISLLSEAALADDWNRPEEDQAWAALQPKTCSS